jgi:DMSO reductase anchor subunit
MEEKDVIRFWVDSLCVGAMLVCAILRLADQLNALAFTWVVLLSVLTMLAVRVIPFLAKKLKRK